jgi:hypothetical protein
MEYKIIQIEKYLIAIEESKITEGDYGLGFAEGIKGYGRGYFLFFHDGSNRAKINTIAENTYKVVAHLPLDDSEILENVPLLPPFEQEDDVEYIANKLTQHLTFPAERREGIILGYNKAKEKYLREIDKQISDFKHDLKECTSNNIKQNCESAIFGLTRLQQSLSQPKYPIAFECELATLETKDLGNDYSEFTQPLQKRWIGKYIY